MTTNSNIFSFPLIRLQTTDSTPETVQTAWSTIQTNFPFASEFKVAVRLQLWIVAEECFKYDIRMIFKNPRKHLNKERFRYLDGYRKNFQEMRKLVKWDCPQHPYIEARSWHRDMDLEFKSLKSFLTSCSDFLSGDPSKDIDEVTKTLHMFLKYFTQPPWNITDLSYLPFFKLIMARRLQRLICLEYDNENLETDGDSPSMIMNSNNEMTIAPTESDEKTTLSALFKDSIQLNSLSNETEKEGISLVIEGADKGCIRTILQGMSTAGWEVSARPGSWNSIMAWLSRVSHPSANSDADQSPSTSGSEVVEL